MRVSSPAALALLAGLLALGCDTERVPVPPAGGPRDAGAAVDAAPGADADPNADAADPGSDASPSGADAGVTDSGVAPITVTPGAWTWVDFPTTACDDGSPTGIGVNAAPAGSKNLIIFLNGGGACWDYATCVELNTSTHGPFGAAQFGQIAPFLVGGAFSRTSNDNPFRDWSYVFVPYCTGDLHAGSRVAEYAGPGGTRRIHHVGHTNTLAFLARLRATFPDADKLVLSGSSAGGYGTIFNYDALRALWPDAQGFLLDDSGPLLPGSATPQALRDTWAASWGMGPLLERVCGASCSMDYAIGYDALAARHPADRFALLSSLQDETIRSYLGLSPQAFQSALLEAATNSIEPTANFEYFIVPGASHTMLGAPQSFTSRGTGLFTWLRQMVEDDAAWTSTRP